MYGSESELSDDSEPEVPLLSVESTGKKRSFTTTEKTSALVGGSSSTKRSRISRLRVGVNEMLASLNNDDTIEGNIVAEASAEQSDRRSFETPHCPRSRSAPGSSSRILEKTLGRKTAVTKRKAISHSATRSEGGRAANTHSKSLDINQVTPSRSHVRTDVSADLDISGDENFDSESTHESDQQSPSQIPAVSQQPDVSAALKEITSLLNTVVKRIDRVENELSKRQSTSLSSSSAGERSKKSKVPLIVRSEVRKTYNLLVEDLENDFEGFDLDPSAPFNSRTNEACVTRLIKEVMGNNPQFQACDVRTAARTYYRTKSQEKSLKERGKYEERGRARRRRERLLRKLQERLSIFQKSDMSPKAKEKWSKVLQPDVMSSEESGPEGEDMFVRKLPWRSMLVDNFFAELDGKSLEKKTAQAIRQRKKRMFSVNVSARSPPSGLPKWAISS